MTVELNDARYKRLKKDADDNRAIISVVRWTMLIFVFIVFMAIYGCHAVDMHKQIEQAHVNAEVRAIESQGMDEDQYVEWLKAKNGE